MNTMGSCLFPRIVGNSIFGNTNRIQSVAVPLLCETEGVQGGDISGSSYI